MPSNGLVLFKCSTASLPSPRCFILPQPTLAGLRTRLSKEFSLQHPKIQYLSDGNLIELNEEEDLMVSLLTAQIVDGKKVVELSLSQAKENISKEQNHKQQIEKRDHKVQIRDNTCRMFVKGRTCKFGDKCKFAHSQPQSQPQKQKQKQKQKQQKEQGKKSNDRSAGNKATPHEAKTATREYEPFRSTFHIDAWLDKRMAEASENNGLLIYVLCNEINMKIMGDISSRKFLHHKTVSKLLELLTHKDVRDTHAQVSMVILEREREQRAESRKQREKNEGIN